MTIQGNYNSQESKLLDIFFEFCTAQKKDPKKPCETNATTELWLEDVSFIEIFAGQTYKPYNFKNEPVIKNVPRLNYFDFDRE